MSLLTLCVCLFAAFLDPSDEEGWSFVESERPCDLLAKDEISRNRENNMIMAPRQLLEKDQALFLFEFFVLRYSSVLQNETNDAALTIYFSSRCAFCLFNLDSEDCLQTTRSTPYDR